MREFVGRWEEGAGRRHACSRSVKCSRCGPLSPALAPLLSCLPAPRPFLPRRPPLCLSPFSPYALPPPPEDPLLTHLHLPHFVPTCPPNRPSRSLPRSPLLPPQLQVQCLSPTLSSLPPNRPSPPRPPLCSPAPAAAGTAFRTAASAGCWGPLLQQLLQTLLQLLQQQVRVLQHRSPCAVS